jgi:hypothetical protein
LGQQITRQIAEDFQLGENSRIDHPSQIDDESQIGHEAQIGDSSQIGQASDIGSALQIDFEDADLDAEEADNAANRQMPRVYMNELSHRFEDLGELDEEDAPLPGEGPADVAEAETEERWTAREGRELEFVQGRKYEQLIVDGVSH